MGGETLIGMIRLRQLGMCLLLAQIRPRPSSQKPELKADLSAKEKTDLGLQAM